MSEVEVKKVHNNGSFRASENPKDSDAPVSGKVIKTRRLVKKQASFNSTKYTIWKAGHSICFAFGLIWMVGFFLRLPNRYYLLSLCYELSLLGSLTSLVVTFSHKFGLQALPSFTVLLAQQNLQYIILGTIWLFTFGSIFKLLPYFLLAIIHLGENFKVAPIKAADNVLSAIIAYDEFALILLLLLKTLFLRGSSGYQLTIILVFYWVRILFNDETKESFAALLTLLDIRLKNVKNKKVQHIWTKIKLILKDKSEDSNMDQ